MSKWDLAMPEGDDTRTPLRGVATIALVALGAIIFVSVGASRTGVATEASFAAINEAYLTADGPQSEPLYGEQVSVQATVPANPRAPAIAAR